MRPAAIVGWTGNGSLEDLARTVVHKVRPGEGRVERATRSVLVRGGDPVATASTLSRLPGASWIAVGYEFQGLASCLSKLSLLASRYLDDGTTFRVTAEVSQSRKQEGDLLIEATSALLKSSKGSRVDEKHPQVTFRIVMVREKGAVGVELREGPGGVPTSSRLTASCLVSGGYHSTVTAWMAALSGFSLTLVHSRDDDESLRQVARLYAELSKRTDPATLKLRILEGDGGPGDRIASWLAAAKGEVFTGAHPECRGTRGMELLRRFPPAQFPLLLLQEREVRSRLDELGIRGKQSDVTARLSFSGRKAVFRVASFGSVEADQNAVLDAVLR